MSTISGVGGLVNPSFYSTSRAPAPQTAEKNNDSGPGASDLRQAPAPTLVGTINLVV
jgi:hypothetical protein